LSFALSSSGLLHSRRARYLPSHFSRSRTYALLPNQARSFRSSFVNARRSLIAGRPQLHGVVAPLCSRYCSCRWRRRSCCLTIRSSGPRSVVSVFPVMLRAAAAYLKR